ncbi:MAG: hypothetical protein WD944_12515 [Steroidobacteraceae bacterium]
MIRNKPLLTHVATTLLATLALGAPVRAQEFQPYPTPRITVEQWTSYLATVRANLEPTAEIYPEKHVVIFSDQRSRTFYIFTTKDHPAHPAWITRQIVEEGGEVSVRQIGYFAGSEERFAKLFSKYQKMNEELREDVLRRNQ